MGAMDSNIWNIRQPIESIVKKRAKQLARRKNPEIVPEVATEEEATGGSNVGNDSDQEHSNDSEQEHSMTSMD